MGVKLFVIFSEEIKKLDLYIPIVSFMTLILFSTIISGISLEEGQTYQFFDLVSTPKSAEKSSGSSF